MEENSSQKSTNDLGEIVLCAANAYKKKYYFNPMFSILPKHIQDELQIMCVMYTEEIGGIFTVSYDPKGNLELTTEALEGDAMYDEIGGALRIKELREKKNELFSSLEMFYKVFVSGELQAKVKKENS